jgi:uncharacterized membrane protein YphA (DoxX/SURF4 family)
MNKSVQNIATIAARLLLGLIFFVFGLNGFLHFIPMPPPSGESGAFLMALFATGYMFPLIKGIEVIGGLLLLANRAVPFALVILAPIIVNIAAYHVLLEPGYGMVVTLGVLTSFLAYVHREQFAPLFTSKAAQPVTTEVKRSVEAH